jgi:YegS/Rv2252/BmrU family lipid kinase
VTPRRTLLIVNPKARRGADPEANAAERLRELGLDVIEAACTGDEKPADLIRRHGAEVDVVVIGGGDGTLSAAVAGIVETGLPLGILPLGTANNVARTLEIPTDIDEACAIIAAGHTRRIDLGSVNGVYFFTTASLGLSVAITRQLDPAAKRRWGVLAYGLAALQVLSHVRPFTAEVVWSGGTERSRTVQIVVGNGPHYGSALTVATDAAIDDAQLDLYSIELRTWYHLLALLPALKRGSHGERKGVFALRAKEIEVRTPSRSHHIDLDGELGARTPAVFRVVPGAVAVCVKAPDGAGEVEA